MDPALDTVRRDALWFEPTADGMAPLLEADWPDHARGEMPAE